MKYKANPKKIVRSVLLPITMLSLLTVLSCNKSQKDQSTTDSSLNKTETQATDKDTVAKKDKRTPAPDLGKMQGKEAEAFYIAVNAVMWGYPMVKYEELMRGRTLPDVEATSGNPRSLVNQFGLMRHLRGPEFKQVATPNNDTYYAQAYCDLSREPMIVSVPAVDNKRYYGIQLWDPNGDTFNYIGTRTTGRAKGDYALVGPNWKGTLPKGVKRIDCPYNNIVVWGRIGTDGLGDEKNVLAFEDALRLEPLSQFGKSKDQLPPDADFSAKRVALNYPADLPDGLQFYYQLAEANKHYPPKTWDAVVVASLSDIGYKQNNTVFDYKSLSSDQISGLKKALQFAEHVMDVNAQTTGISVNGWRWSPKSGIMGTDYVFRAAWAKWYTGGNVPAEAIYMDGRTDDKKQPFDASKKYSLHFEKGKQPPVKAFWSLSMYNIGDGSFVENSIKRYSIGDRTKGLVTNPDGSLDIYIQSTAPTDPKQKANWLPTPQSGGFYLDLRLYVPDNSLQEGKWSPPPVKVLD